MSTDPRPINDSPHPLETYGNFDLITRFNVGFADIEISKWRSRESGLSVVHLDCDCACLGLGRGDWLTSSAAPIVHGSFILGTESA